MRLICPNCDAQYEVDDDLVPEEGREVQCSNCATTWFQAGAGSDTPTETDQNDLEDEPDFTPPQEDQFFEDDDPSVAPDENDLSDEDSAISAAAALAAARNARQPRRPELSPEDLDVIQQEVARETAARQEEAGGLETQPDLGLDDTVSTEMANAARDRVADHREDSAEEAIRDDATASEDSKTKGGLLPDIEEISSTLKDAPTQEAEGETGPTAEQRLARGRRGFRIGFGLALLVFAGLILAYLRQAEITEQFPQLAGQINQYGETVDGLRVQLDQTAQLLVERINGIIDGVSN